MLRETWTVSLEKSVCGPHSCRHNLLLTSWFVSDLAPCLEAVLLLLWMFIVVWHVIQHIPLFLLLGTLFTLSCQSTTSFTSFTVQIWTYGPTLIQRLSLVVLWATREVHCFMRFTITGMFPALTRPDVSWICTNKGTVSVYSTKFDPELSFSGCSVTCLISHTSMDTCFRMLARWHLAIWSACQKDSL